jgi:hypothetical protein
MTTESTARATRLAAGSIATAVAITGLVAVPAQADPSTVRVHLAELGTEVSGYPATQWFYGASAHPNTGAAIVDGKLVLNRKTQLLTQLTGTDLPASVNEILDEGLSVDVAEESDGDGNLQIALGWTGGWTTLRPTSAEAGVNTADPDAIWLSSRPIAGVEEGDTLGEIADAIDAIVGDTGFAYAAVGIQADGADSVDSTIESVTVHDTTYEFVEGLPSVASTTKVQLSEIGEEVDGYPDTAWFLGQNTAVPVNEDSATVTGGNLVLARKTQILTELHDVTSLRSIAANGLAVTTTDATTGDAFLQIAAGWDTGWTTLRPAAATTGVNSAEFDGAWVSSKPLAGDVTTGTLDELVTLIDDAAAGAFDYVAVGAFTDNFTDEGATTVSSFQIGTEAFTFANEAALAVSNVAITGDAKVGSVLTAGYSANYATTTATYQWLRDGKAIKNATSSTYRLTAADLKTKTSVKIIVAKVGISKKVTVTSPKTATVAAGALEFTTVPTIVGTPKVGVALTISRAAAGVESGVAASSYTYQWLRSGTAIKGATKSTYAPVFADLDKELSVKVTAKLSGYSSLAATSAAADEVIAGEFVTKTPTISGTVKVGKVLTAKAGTWTGAPTSIKYRWYADGEVIQYSTAKTLTLTWEEKGAVITLEVVGAKQGYTKATSPLSLGTVTVK